MVCHLRSLQVEAPPVPSSLPEWSATKLSGGSRPKLFAAAEQRLKPQRHSMRQLLPSPPLLQVCRTYRWMTKVHAYACDYGPIEFQETHKDNRKKGCALRLNHRPSKMKRRRLHCQRGRQPSRRARIISSSSTAPRWDAARPTMRIKCQLCRISERVQGLLTPKSV